MSTERTVIALLGSWAEFYVETIEYDYTQEWPATTPPRQSTLDAALQFNNMMKIACDYEPNGTEDRIWCRTYAALSGVPEYKDYISFKNWDFYAITSCMIGLAKAK